MLLICAICGYFEEMDDNAPFDAWPDGYILPDCKWICHDCGSCPECGRTLEKEPDKRAYMYDGVLVYAKPCDDCEALNTKNDMVIS